MTAQRSPSAGDLPIQRRARPRVNVAPLLAALTLACGAPPRAAVDDAPITPPPATGLDCHLHFDPPDQGAAEALAMLDAAGVARGCVLSPGYRAAPGCETTTCAAQRAWTHQVNDWTIAQTDRSDHRLLPFCGVPLTADWVTEEVARCGAAGARGLKLHPVREGLSLQTPETAAALEAVLRTSAAAKLTVLIHIGMDSADEVRAFFAIAGRVPAARIILAHQIAPNLPLLMEAPANVWIEISGLTLAPPEAGAAFVPLWRAFGIHRVLLGSDWPTLGLTPKAHVERLAAYPLEPAEREAVVHGNGQRLLPPR